MYRIAAGCPKLSLMHYVKSLSSLSDVRDCCRISQVVPGCPYLTDYIVMLVDVYNYGYEHPLAHSYSYGS